MIEGIEPEQLSDDELIDVVKNATNDQAILELVRRYTEVTDAIERKAVSVAREMKEAALGNVVAAIGIMDGYGREGVLRAQKHGKVTISRDLIVRPVE